MDLHRRVARRLLALLAPAGVLLSAACADAPVLLKYETKAALEQAREGQADVYAPALLARAEEAYRAGILAIDLQAQRWSPSRDYGVALAHLQIALSRARLAGDIARERRQDLDQRAEALLTTARGSLDNLDFIFAYLSPKTRARSELMHARILYKEAIVFRKRGDLAPALETAGRATQELALLSETLARIIDRYAGSDRLDEYRQWIRETVRESAASESHAILVDKLRHTLTLLKGGRAIRTYRADIGLNGTSDKTMSGDKATPEGRYRIVEKKDLGETHWHKALLINYPNESDRAQFAAAQRRGAISRRARIGSLIEVHGEGGRFQDWTEGCIALDNADIDELFRIVQVGTPITIVGYEGDDWLDSRASRSSSDGLASTDRPASRRGARGRGMQR
jgi:hypothetical protein